MNTILNLGFILLVGLLAERLIQKIKLPTVTAFILVGILGEGFQVIDTRFLVAPR